MAGINVEIGLEDKSFSKAMKEIDSQCKILDDTIREIDKNIDSFGDNFDGAAQRAEAFGKKQEALNKKLELQRNQLKRGERALEEYRNELNRCDTSTTSGKKKAEQLTKAIKNQENANDKLKLSIQNTTVKLKSLATGMKTTETATKNTSDAFSTIANKIKNIDFQAMGQGLISAGQQLQQWARTGINAFSELIEKGVEYSATNAQLEMQYGNLGTATQQAIDNQVKLANSLGLTERQMQSAAISLGSYYTAMGFTDEEAGKLIEKFTVMVADMAAFKDIGFDEALDMVKSALQGNHEAVDSFNVALGEATINESAYAKEIGKTYSEMTEQEKIMARLSVMLEQTATYQGLAAEEAESFGAQLKLVKTEMDEIAGIIGERLLPVLEPYLQKLKEITTEVGEWVKNHPQLTQKYLELAGVITLLVAVFGTLAVIVGAVTLLISPVGLAIMGVVAAVTLIASAVHNFGEKMSNLWQTIVLTSQDAGVFLTGLWSTFCEWLGSRMSSLWGTIKNLWESGCEWVKTKWAEFKEYISTKAQEIVQNVIDKWNEFKTNTVTKFNEIKDTIVTWCEDVYTKMTTKISEVVQGVIDFFAELPGGIGQWLAEGLQKIVDWCVDTEAKMLEAGGNMLTAIGEGLAELPSKMWDWAVNAAQSFINGLLSMAGTISSTVASWFNIGGGGGGTTPQTYTLPTVYTNPYSTQQTLSLATAYSYIPDLDISTYGVSPFANPATIEAQNFQSYVIGNKGNKTIDDEDIYEQLVLMNKLMTKTLQEKRININVDNQTISNSTNEEEAQLAMIRFWSKL